VFAFFAQHIRDAPSRGWGGVPGPRPGQSVVFGHFLADVCRLWGLRTYLPARRETRHRPHL